MFEHPGEKKKAAPAPVATVRPNVDELDEESDAASHISETDYDEETDYEVVNDADECDVEESSQPSDEDSEEDWDETTDDGE